MIATLNLVAVMRAILDAHAELVAAGFDALAHHLIHIGGDAHDLLAHAEEALDRCIAQRDNARPHVPSEAKGEYDTATDILRDIRAQMSTDAR